MLTSEKLRELLRYEPETGLFFRLRSKDRRKGDASTPCGSVNNRGYVSVSLLGKTYRAHRLAWLYVHGEWPKDELDHINRDKKDNRIENLREASKTENNRNRSSWKSGGGPRGVYKRREQQDYRAQIRVNGKLINIGVYASEEEAARAYNEEAKKHFGDFAVLNHEQQKGAA